MVEKTFITLILISLVLVLTFRDLVLLKQTPDTDDTNTKHGTNPSGQVDLSNDEELKSEDVSFKNNEFNEETTNEFADEEIEENTSNLNEPKTIPSLKIKSNQQTLKFLFCYSCGYRNAFEQYSQIIHQKYPELKIIGENYATNQFKIYIAQFLSTLKIIIIGCIILGQNPFVYLNMPTPQIFTWATENKFYASLMIFFISNAIETQLITSGAFEIYLNGIFLNIFFEVLWLTRPLNQEIWEDSKEKTQNFTSCKRRNSSEYNINFFPHFKDVKICNFKDFLINFPKFRMDLKVAVKRKTIRYFKF